MSDVEAQSWAELTKLSRTMRDLIGQEQTTEENVQ